MTTEEIPATHPSPGETLKKYREESKLSVEDIARLMRLEPGIIRALESDQFDRLPAAIYVRGYLRNYAKIVKANADEIIAIYDHGAPAPPEIIPEVKHSSQVSSADKPVKAFTYLLTFCIALLLFVWLYDQFLNSSSNTRPETPVMEEESPLLDLESDLVITKPMEILNDAGTEDEPPVGESAESTTTAAEVTQPPPAVEDPTPPAQTEHPVPAEPRLAPDGPDTLLMKVSVDSWIEVYDRNSYKLYLNLARSGEEIFLRGQAPFAIKLGFSQGVSIEFNGQTYDPAPHSRSGVATFTLGE